MFGDDLAARSFEDNFRQHKPPDNYSAYHYEVKSYNKNKFFTNNPSLISRLHNLMVTAITERKFLLKMIVVVVDDDLVKLITHQRYGMSDTLCRMIHYIASKYNKLIEAQRDFLPIKSKRNSMPYIEAPKHCNFANNTSHEKFNSCLQEISQYFENMHLIPLKKCWDPENSNLYHYESRRFTAEGLATYWLAVDRVVKYIDTIFIKKLLRKDHKIKNFRNLHDKYHWNRDQKQQGKEPEKERKLLPKPPQII